MIYKLLAADKNQTDNVASKVNKKTKNILIINMVSCMMRYEDERPENSTAAVGRCSQFEIII